MTEQEPQVTDVLPQEAAPIEVVWLVADLEHLSAETARGPELAPAAVSVPLEPGREVVFGSGRSAVLRIADPAVSAVHGRLLHAGRCVVLSDLGSRNGVWVGGARVETAELPVGSSFSAGRTTVRIEPARGRRSKECTAPPLELLVGSSPPMRRLAADVRRLANVRLPVLIRGESGTGKDLVARALHEEGPRAAQPFIAINAAAISRELAESELFGHERGAFTGANRDRKGAFREAQGGTLFLDEVAALSLEVQAKLLRAVEEGAIRPVGAGRSAPVDVRLVAATCEPLERLVAEGRFRADFYERLAVCIVRVPPLRDRAGDIGALVRHLLRAAEVGADQVSPAALALLRAQRWPGNVRELRNVVVQAALRSSGTIDAVEIATILAERAPPPIRPRLAPGQALQLYEEVGRNASEAARRAQLPRSTLRDLLRAAKSEQ